MSVDGFDATVERFVKISSGGNVFVMLPEKPNYDKLSPGAIGRIQYRDKMSNISSNYGTLFIKSINGCCGEVIEPETYAFFGAREIELGFVESNGSIGVYGEIIFGTDEVSVSENLKVLIEFM